MHIFDKNQTANIRTCRCCGCDDLHACQVAPGVGCSWVLLDIEGPTGICSACAAQLDYDPVLLARISRESLAAAFIEGEA